MKIAVFGASGKTGREVVRQALEKGMEVNAFVRDSAKMTITDPKLTVVQGDVMLAESVGKGVEGVDAVIVALGASQNSTGPVNSVGTQNIIQAMSNNGVKRLVVEGSYPMSGSPESMEFLGKMMPADQISGLQSFIDDKAGQELLTRGSTLDWTLVRPLSLTEGPLSGSYKSGESLEVKPGDQISRADVADFMLKCLQDPSTVGKTITIAS